MGQLQLHLKGKGMENGCTLIDLLRVLRQRQKLFAGCAKACAHLTLSAIPISSCWWRWGIQSFTFPHHGQSPVTFNWSLYIRVSGLLGCWWSVSPSFPTLLKLTVKEAYVGCLNFTTDAWTSPNHWAYIALCVHLEQKGQPFSMVLDIVKMAEVGPSLTCTVSAQVKKVYLVSFWHQSCCCNHQDPARLSNLRQGQHCQFLNKK